MFEERRKLGSGSCMLFHHLKSSRRAFYPLFLGLRQLTCGRYRFGRLPICRPEPIPSHGLAVGAIVYFAIFDHLIAILLGHAALERGLGNHQLRHLDLPTPALSP